MTSTLLPERVVLRKKKKRARQEIVPTGLYPWSVFLFLGPKSENDPRWVVFEYSSNLTKVRVLADSHGLGDQGLGTGLVVRGAAVVKSTIMVF